MSEPFSIDEIARLKPFFTNLTDSIFGLRLPQEVAGALFSRYSRSSNGLREIFLKEFLGNSDLALQLQRGETTSPANDEGLAKARAFYDRVLVGYGDDSIAQLGGAHIACENISNVAAKILEDARIGIAPLEKSSRYVRFDNKGPDGDYLFCKEPTLMGSKYREAYVGCMQHLFKTYAEQIEPMIQFVRRSLPIETLEWKDPKTGDPFDYRIAQNDDRLLKWVESAYRSTVRAQACDILRSYLPASTLTNVGIFGVGQAFEQMLNKLYSNDLAEARFIGESMNSALKVLIPSFVKRARSDNYRIATNTASRSLAQTLVRGIAVEKAPAVQLVDYDEDAETRILAAVLYRFAHHPLDQLRDCVRTMDQPETARLFDTYVGDRGSRRDKPGRALENSYYTFDILGNLGLYRDLQRHRILTQERQDFTTAHGYDMPEELREAGFEEPFKECMEMADTLYRTISVDYPLEAQYVVPFAYKVRWYMKLNLREAIHLGELRTMPQGHPDYRTIVQEMWRLISDVHPNLARSARFLDWNTYRLGRLQSEIRSEFKKSSLK